MKRSAVIILIVAFVFCARVGIRLLWLTEAPKSLTVVGRLAISSPQQVILFGQKIDINRATFSHLKILPGIGPTLARRIIARRARIGCFTSVDDLLKVKGIGRSKLADFYRYVDAL